MQKVFEKLDQQPKVSQNDLEQLVAACNSFVKAHVARDERTTTALRRNHLNTKSISPIAPPLLFGNCLG